MQCGVSNIKQLPQRALAAPRDHQQLHLFWQLSLTLRVCSVAGCHSWAEAHSTKELKLYSTRKRNYKTHVPGERVNALCLLPKMWKTTATSVLPCTGTPQAMEGLSPSGITPANATSEEQHHRPSALTLLRYTSLTTTLIGFLTGKKGDENYTCLHAGERQLSYLHLQIKGKEHF